MDNFNQNNYGGMNNGFNPQMNRGNAPDYILWLILGIIQICLLCCCNLFTCMCGVITVIIAVQANKYFKCGNYAMYQGKIRSAKTVNIIGWVLMIVSLAINIFSGVFSAIVELF